MRDIKLIKISIILLSKVTIGLRTRTFILTIKLTRRLWNITSVYQLAKMWRKLYCTPWQWSVTFKCQTNVSMTPQNNSKDVTMLKRHTSFSENERYKIKVLVLYYAPVSTIRHYFCSCMFVFVFFFIWLTFWMIK